jgi:hypothetical protein
MIALMRDEPEREYQCKRCPAVFKSRCRNVKFCPNCRKTVAVELQVRAREKRHASRKAR